MTKMQYKTHKEIDEDYIRRGIFSREEISKMNNQVEQIRLVLMESQSSAKEFLRYKMGFIKFNLWRIFTGFPFGVYLSAGFGKDGWIEKAKELGWRDELKDKINKLIEVKE